MARHRAGCAMARGPPCGRSTVANQPPPSTLKTAPLSAARRPEAMRVCTPTPRAPAPVNPGALPDGIATRATLTGAGFSP